MIYAMSDIHGMYEKYMTMLETIKFNAEDSLYVLGDCIDRGADGIKVLQDIMGRKNVTMLLGNHEDMALSCIRGYINPELFDENVRDNLELWVYNGGITTIDHFLYDLNSDEQRKIYEFLQRLPLYNEIELNGFKFFFCHTVRPSYGPVDLHLLTKQDYIWGQQTYTNRYSENERDLLITGHTPTGLINGKYMGKIYTANGNIAIDCGACFEESGGRLGCLCLNTMEEYYV